MARLQILSGKREGDFLELGVGTYQIGTRRAAEIQLRDRDIAYKHANVVVEAGGLFIEDLGSTKGTFVNGQQLGENTKARVKVQDKVLVGSTEMLVVDDSPTGPTGPAAAPAPDAAAASGSGASPDKPIEKDDAKKLEPAAASATSTLTREPEGAVARAASPAKTTFSSSVESSTTAAWAAMPAADSAALEAELKELRRKLDTKEKENEALMKALEGSAHPEDDADTSTGFMPGELSGDLEARVLELQQQADELQARLLEKDQALKDREKELEGEVEAQKKLLAAEKKTRAALEKELLKTKDKQDAATDEEKARADELKTYEEANTQLVLENDELKEKVEIFRYQIEQEASRRGELVRERVKELHAENKRLQEANAELRTLVEAYEEKIDELDERLEELEGENEELERLLDEVRSELKKSKSERETLQKTVRQKTQRLEDRVSELEAENQRARAAGERALAAAATPSFSNAGSQANGTPEGEANVLRSRLARLEALFDDAEKVDRARELEKRVGELEAEAVGLRKRLEGAPKVQDAAGELATALAKVEELEQRVRTDAKRLERLERKNRELVKANVAAELSRNEKK